MLAASVIPYPPSDVGFPVRSANATVVKKLVPVIVAPEKSTAVPVGKSTLLEPLPIVTNVVCVVPMFTLPDVSAHYHL